MSPRSRRGRFILCGRPRRRTHDSLAMTYSLQVEPFISEIEKYPIIWDQNHEEHKSKCRKNEVWAEIARVFIDDFEDMSEFEKIDVYKKLNSKWRNIRDAYRRMAKKRNPKRLYTYAKNLYFLDSQYKANSEDEWPSDNGDDQSEALNKSSDRRKDGDSKRKRIKTEIQFDDNPIEYMNSFAESNYNAEDDDRLFFESLLPAIKQFDMDQKLEFRSDVLKLVKTIRSRISNTSAD